MIRLRALGQCVFEVGAHRITPESDVLFAVLLLLACRQGQAMRRVELLELLWPESDERSARHRLRQALYQVRKLGAPVASAESSVSLRRRDVELDYVVCRQSREAFLASVASARPLDVLPRYAPRFSRPFARWVDLERDNVRSSLRRHLSSMIDEARNRRDHAETIALAQACLDLDPLNSDATIGLAEALALRGERHAAIAVIDRYCEDRQESTGEPSRHLADLRRRIAGCSRRARQEAAYLKCPLVGRVEILRDLEGWIQRSGISPRIVALVGDAGIGKTRLMQESVEAATVLGVRCLSYRAITNGGDRPLVGLFDLLPSLLSLPGAVGCAPESYQRLTSLASGVELLPGSLPEDTTDSAFRFAMLRRSVLDLFDAVLAEIDVVIAIDDAHSLDSPTLEILADAASSEGNRPGLMLAIRAGSATVGLVEKRHAQVVRVPRLNDTDSRAILTHSLTASVISQRSRLIDWAVDLANGNPFFLSELAAQCHDESANESLPHSVQIMLERRLNALSANAQLVLQAFVLLAHNASVTRVELMLGIPPHAMASALGELELGGLVTSRDGSVGCRHDLIAEAVLGDVRTTLASYLHRRCAIVLDTEWRKSPAVSLAWDCIRHWEAAQEPSRALELTGLIVDRLLSLGLPRAAADLCSQAERYCRTAEERADWLLRCSRAQRLLYDWEAVVRSLEARGAILSSIQRPSDRFSDDEIALVEARWWRDTNGQVIRSASKRVANTRAPILHRLQMAVLALIVADNQQRRREAQRIVQAIETLNPATPREDLEKSKALLIYHTSFGNLDHALTVGRRVVELERLSGSSANLLKALRWLSNPMRLTDDSAGALRVLREAFQHASRLELRAEMWAASYYLQAVALDFEDIPLSLEWTPIFADLAGDAAVHALRAVDFNYFIARVEFSRGNVAAAKELLDRARSLQRTLPRVRGEQAVLGLDLLIRTRCGDRLPAGKLDRLRALHLRSRDSGTRDFEAASLFQCLAYAGRTTEAESLYRYYLSVRRTRTRPHSTLLEFSA